MPILIDGHNLIGHLPMLSLQDPDDEEKLVGLLQSYQARSGKAVTVVFDPGTAFALSSTRRFGEIRVTFAAQGSSADAVITGLVRRSREPHGWLVITSDGRLAETVRQQGARVRSAEDFAAELVAAPDEAPDWKEVPPSPDDVDKWLALFGSQD